MVYRYSEANIPQESAGCVFLALYGMLTSPPRPGQAGSSGYPRTTSSKCVAWSSRPCMHRARQRPPFWDRSVPAILNYDWSLLFRQGLKRGEAVAGGGGTYQPGAELSGSGVIDRWGVIR